MRVPHGLLLCAAIAATTPAHAQKGNAPQWGNLAAKPAVRGDLGGDHLVTVSVPYQLASLDPDIEKVGIGCRIGFQLPTFSGTSDHEVDIVPVGGGASGTATVTWDAADIDPAADPSTIVGDRCWLIFYIRAIGGVSFEVARPGAPHSAGLSQASASHEPAIQPQAGAPRQTQESFSFPD